MKHLYAICCLLLVALGLPPGRLRAQTLDPAFQPVILKTPYLGGLQTGAQVLAVQPDGKILVAGGFDYAGGALASKIMRLNADGTLDATFNPGGTGANGFIGAVAVQPDGKIIIVGGFTAYNGTPQLAQARLHANGTLDASFAGLPVAQVRQLTAVALQPDGKVLVGGNAGFGSTPLPTVVRLTASGVPDASFSAPASTVGDVVRAVLVQADGKILLGGSGTSTFASSFLIAGLARLNADGSADLSFSSPLAANSTVITYALAQQPDGKLLVGGNLAPMGSVNPGVLRLLPGGGVDNTFAQGSGPATATGTAAGVRTLLLLPSGNVLVGGTFAQYNGVARGRVVRLLPTGAVDAGFATGAGANNSVAALATTASGQALVAGSLTQYDGGPARTGLVRLSATGGEDAAFTPPLLEGRGTVSRAGLLANGQLLVQGSATSLNGSPLAGSSTVVRRFNADGTLDGSYTSTAGTLLSPQPDGTFFALGFNTAGTQYQLLRILPSGSLDNTFANPAYSSAGITGLIAPLGVVVQPDGKLLVHGTFTTFGGASRNGLVRLNADGSVDNSFVPPAGMLQRQVYTLSLQPSGKLVISYQELMAGSLNFTTGDGTMLLRLNADGSTDGSFPAGTGANTGAFFSVLAQPDGKLLLSGASSFNGQAIPYGLARLTPDGAVDNTLSQVSAAYSPVLVQADGRILASTDTGSPRLYGATALVRLNGNGSRDATFAPLSVPSNIFIGENSFSGYLSQPADGKIIAYGSFTSVLGQGRGGLARLVPGVATATQAAAAVRPLAVYPNPTRQQLTVARPGLTQPAQAALLSFTGQLVRQWPLAAGQAEARLDLSAVAAGLYVLRIPTAAGVYQQKVVVAP